MRSLTCLIAAMLGSAALHAHEIGTTRVAVVFEQGRTYNIELVTDAQALVEKLAVSAGQPMPPRHSPSHLQSLLAGFDQNFRRRLKIAFDAAEVQPAIAYAVTPGADASSAVATIRLTGQVPPNARHFTWTYAWTFA